MGRGADRSHNVFSHTYIRFMVVLSVLRTCVRVFFMSVFLGVLCGSCTMYIFS